MPHTEAAEVEQVPPTTNDGETTFLWVDDSGKQRGTVAVLTTMPNLGPPILPSSNTLLPSPRNRHPSILSLREEEPPHAGRQVAVMRHEAPVELVRAHCLEGEECGEHVRLDSFVAAV